MIVYCFAFLLPEAYSLPIVRPQRNILCLARYSGCGHIPIKLFSARDWKKYGILYGRTKAYPRHREETMSKPMTSARPEEDVVTSRTSPEAAEKIRQASIELMERNAKLYKELEDQ